MIHATPKQQPTKGRNRARKERRSNCTTLSCHRCLGEDGGRSGRFAVDAFWLYIGLHWAGLHVIPERPDSYEIGLQFHTYIHLNYGLVGWLSFAPWEQFAILLEWWRLTYPSRFTAQEMFRSWRLPCFFHNEKIPCDLSSHYILTHLDGWFGCPQHLFSFIMMAVVPDMIPDMKLENHCQA